MQWFFLEAVEKAVTKQNVIIIIIKNMYTYRRLMR